MSTRTKRTLNPTQVDCGFLGVMSAPPGSPTVTERFDAWLLTVLWATFMIWEEVGNPHMGSREA